MRLIYRNANGAFNFTKYSPEQDDLPGYAVLSHTWSLDHSSEVTFADINHGIESNKPASYAKIKFCSEQAAKDDLEHFWVDTCCINKDSDAEVTEAVNRMFHWYSRAQVCYVYLSDVSATDNGVAQSTQSPSWQNAFRNCRWFTRGWTLQELLAPQQVRFYSREGTFLGDKMTLQISIHDATGIPIDVLNGTPLAKYSILEREAWARGRKTTRSEDKVYSLLGLLGVFMPLIYGEGYANAWSRLRDAIEGKRRDEAEVVRVLGKLPRSATAAYDSPGNQHRSSCLPNTRVDILDEIKAWTDRTDSRLFFWLSGMAGTGKTTIAVTTARQLSEQGKLGGSFFFSKGSGDDGHAGKLITTLAFDLASRIPSTAPFIRDALLVNENITQASMQLQWEKLILEPLSRTDGEARPSSVTFVLDALDECDKHDQLFETFRWLLTMSQRTTAHPRLLVTSRSDKIIRRSFRTLPETGWQGFVLHDVSPTIINQDLTLFIEKQLRAMRADKVLTLASTGPDVVQKLVSMSCGLFVWASTACRFIRGEGIRAESRMATLIDDHAARADPAKQLDQMYDTVLENYIRRRSTLVDDEEAETSQSLRNMLGTMVALLSPLSTRALASFLETTPHDVLETLTNLDSIFDLSEESDRTIRLHHPSLREYLLDASRCADPRFLINEPAAHASLADHCVRVMSRKLHENICDLPIDTRIESLDRARVQQHLSPELQYACQYWVEHFRRSGARLQDNDRAHGFLQTHLKHWLEVMSLMRRFSETSAMLRTYQSLLHPADNQVQLPFVKAMRQDLFRSQTTIEHTPLQLYHGLSNTLFTDSRLSRWRSREQGQQLQPQGQEAVPLALLEYNYVSDLAFTPDGRYLASGSTHPWARVWDVTSRAPYGRFDGQTDKVSSVAISMDGKLLAAGSDDFTMTVYDMRTKFIRWKSAAHKRWVNTVCFSPDGELLASGSSDETIRIYNAVDGIPRETVEPRLSGINAIVFSSDSTLLACGTASGRVLVRSLVQSATLLVLDGHAGPVNSVDFSPDGRRLASGSDDGTMIIWDLASGLESVVMRGHKKRIWDVTFSREGLIIASASEDRSIKLWHSETGETVHTLWGHKSGVNSVRYSPNGHILASGAFNDEVRLWDARTGRHISKLDDFDEDA